MVASIPKYMLMVKVEPGEKSPIPFSQDAINSDSLVVVIDELDGKLYFWMGKNRSLVDKRAAMRVAKSILKSGFAYGKFHVGHGLGEMVEIDESSLSEPEAKEKLAALNSLFKRPYKLKDKFLAEVEVTLPTPEAVSPPAHPPETEREEAVMPEQVEAQAEEAVPPPLEEQHPTPAAVESPLIDPELVGKVKLGLLFNILTEEFPVLFVSRKEGEAGPVFEFESSEGPIARVSVEGKDLVVSYGSDFAGRRDKIIGTLKNLVAKLFPP